MYTNASDYIDQSYLHIGIDDTDSIDGRCTTHLAFILCKYLLDKNASFLDYPLLVRLNPNIPWKTRGNASVCIRVSLDKSKISCQDIMKDIVSIFSSNLESGSNTNPGLVFFNNFAIPHDIRAFSDLAIRKLVSIEDAIGLLKKYQANYVVFGNGRGLIGALAAIGNLLENDFTYELISYRKNKNCGMIREIEKENIKMLDKETFPHTYNSYDYFNERVLICPHGPDPVFCGIRGENPDTLSFFFKNILIKEDLEGYVIFRSNQGTNMHLDKKLSLSEIKPFDCGYSICTVMSKPMVIKGGHTFFEVADESHSSAIAAVFEPTGIATRASQLEVGDVIEIGYGVQDKGQKKTLNIEYLKVVKLVKKYSIKNPICKTCNIRVKSEGKNKGYQCKRCKSKVKLEKLLVDMPRNLEEKLYLPDLKAHRHLTKPYQRYGKEQCRIRQYEIRLNSKWYNFEAYSKFLKLAGG